jgi:hypothetical protein
MDKRRAVITYQLDIDPDADHPSTPAQKRSFSRFSSAVILAICTVAIIAASWGIADIAYRNDEPCRLLVINDVKMEPGEILFNITLELLTANLTTEVSCFHSEAACYDIFVPGANLTCYKTLFSNSFLVQSEPPIPLGYIIMIYIVIMVIIVMPALFCCTLQFYVLCCSQDGSVRCCHKRKHDYTAVPTG